MALRSLQALVGREAFLRGMRRFAADWRYRHPYPEDFYLAFQEGADADVQWYFEDVFRSTKTVDWRCEVAQTRDPRSSGWFRCDDGSRTSECAPELMAAADEAARATATTDRRGFVGGGGRGGEAEEALRLRRRPAPAGSCSSRSRCS